MRRIALATLSMLPLTGCGYVTSLSTGHIALRDDGPIGPDKALISSENTHVFDPTCRVVQNKRQYREIVVDAGPAVLQVECSRVTGFFGEKTEHLGRANIAFNAKAAHQYQVEFSEEFGFAHVTVTAANDGSAVIQRSLLSLRLGAQARVTHVTLVSRSGDGIIPCRFGRPWAERRASAVRQPADAFVHIPFSHQIVAECSTYAYLTGYVQQRYEVYVDFVPVSGRLYTVHMDRNDPTFVFVTDVSSEVRTIAHMKATRIH